MACLCGLNERMQRPMRPFSKTTLRGHVSLNTESTPQLCDEHRPFSIRRGAGERYDPANRRRQAEVRATRDGPSSPLKLRHCLRDTVRGQPYLAPDLLQLKKGQAVAGGEPCWRVVLTESKIENLPNFPVPKPAFVAHVESQYPWACRSAATIVTTLGISAQTAPSKLVSTQANGEQKRLHIAFLGGRRGEAKRSRAARSARSAQAATYCHGKHARNEIGTAVGRDHLRPIALLTCPFGLYMVAVQYRTEPLMPTTISYSYARQHLASLLDQAEDRQEPVFISRRDHEDMVLMPAAEFRAVQETAHLLRSPENVRRLLRALQRALEGSVEPKSLDELRSELDLQEAEG